MPEYKLGKSPARHDPRTFDYAKYRTGNATPPPDAHWGHGLPFTMLANDKYGDCVEAGYAHMVQIWGDRAGNPFVPDDADTLAAYTAIAGFNPNDPNTDKGTDMLTAVNYWKSTGMNGHQITAFASLNPLDANQMKEAIAFFGGAYIGVALPISAQTQVGQEWTVTQGPDAQAGSWGGHCIPLCGYDGSRLWCVTWGALQSMTWEFLTTYCVTPETRVLTADLRWIPVGTVRPGEMLLAFDEDQRIPAQEGYKRRGRMYRGTAVKSVRLVDQPCFELEFADGTVVRCSQDHKWLTYGSGSGSRWLTTANLRCGPEYASHVVKPLDVWDDAERSYEHGYLSAAFDGEGCLTQRGLTADAKGLAGTSVSFAQKDNAMLDKTKRAIKDLGFSYNEHDQVDSGVHHLSISSRREVLKFLGTVRPERLLAKFRPDVLGLMGHRTTRLVRREFIGTQTVVAMQTDSRTFFAEGLASHNCDEAYVLLAQEWMQSSGVSPSNLAWGQLLADLANL